MCCVCVYTVDRLLDIKFNVLLTGKQCKKQRGKMCPSLPLNCILLSMKLDQ